MLTVYGIETTTGFFNNEAVVSVVATVLTVYGIETKHNELSLETMLNRCNSAYRLRY